MILQAACFWDHFQTQCINSFTKSWNLPIWIVPVCLLYLSITATNTTQTHTGLIFILVCVSAGRMRGGGCEDGGPRLPEWTLVFAKEVHWKKTKIPFWNSLNSFIQRIVVFLWSEKISSHYGVFHKHSLSTEVESLVFVHDLEMCSSGNWTLRNAGIMLKVNALLFSNSSLLFILFITLIYFSTLSEQWKIFWNTLKYPCLLHHSTSVWLMAFRKLYVLSNV